MNNAPTTTSWFLQSRSVLFSVPELPLVEKASAKAPSLRLRRRFSNVIIALWGSLVFGLPVSCAFGFEVLGPVETLDNGVVTVQVALRVGRLVSYHRKDEAEWIAVTDKESNPAWHWNAWGGDHVWPTAQMLSPQIYHNTGFDPVIDGQPWKLISKTASSLEMISGVSPELGLQITRRIELVEDSSEVLHTFRLERISPSNFPVHLWTVSGLRSGDYVLMESDPAGAHPQGRPFKAWTEGYPANPQARLLDTAHCLQVPWPSEKLKVGTYGRWIALVSGSSAFLQKIEYDSALLFLEASNLQTYLDPQGGIFEIETLSPTWFLRPGETREWKVRWRLLDFPQKATTGQQRAEFLSRQ